MREALVVLHLLAAAYWLGGILTLAVVAVTAHRTLGRDDFRRLMSRTGRGFAVGAALAWLVLGATGLVLAGGRWSDTLKLKTGFAAFALAAAVLHSLLGRRTASAAAVAASRLLQPAILLATLAVFVLAVRLAERG